MKQNLLSLLFFLSYYSLTIAQDSLSNYSLTELDQRYHQTSVYATKLTYALAMLDKGKQELDYKDTMYNDILYNVALAYHMNGNYEEAEQSYLEALEHQSELASKFTHRYALILDQLGLLHNNLGNYETAHNYYLEALNIRKKVLHTKHPDYAFSLNNLGEVYYYDGDYEKAEEYYKKGLEIYEATIGKQTALYAAIKNDLGILYNDWGKYEEAEKHLVEALDIRKEVLGEQDTDYAASLDNLGILYSDIGDHKEAEKLFLKALAINKIISGEDHPDYAATLNNLAYLYEDYGDYQKAEYYYLKILEIEKNTVGENHPDYAISLNNLNALYTELGEYKKAEYYGLQGLEICKNTLGEDHPDYSIHLSNLGLLYLELKAFKKAEYYTLQTLELDKKILGEDHPNYAISLSNLGILYQDTKEHDKAIEYFNQVLANNKKTYGEKHSEYAVTLNLLGYSYYKLTEYEKAKNYYLEALGIYATSFGKKHPKFIKNLNHLAEVHLASKDYTQAQEYISLAISVNSGTDLENDISNLSSDKIISAPLISWEEMIASLQLAYNLLEFQQTTEAKKQQVIIADLALKILENGKNELSDDSDKLRILKSKSDWILQSMKVLDLEKDKAKVFSIMEQEKGVLLLDEAANEQAYAQGLLPDSLIEKEVELKETYSETKAALSEKRSQTELDSLLNELNNLNTTIAYFEKEIKEKYPKYAAMRFQHDKVQAQDVQKLLAPNTAMIEYLVGDSVVYIFYLDKEQLDIHKWEVAKDSLNAYVHQLYRTLGNYSLIHKNAQKSYDRYTQSAHWLYQHLLAPVLNKKSGIEKLIIIPDGELGHLPFGTFLVEKAQNEQNYSNLHYLIQDYDISYNYAASLWKQNVTAQGQQNNGQILGIAANYNIDFDTTQNHWRLPAELRLRKRLTPLPAARLEVQQLEKIYKGFYAFDSLASEQTFKEKANQYAVIHLAMHGMLNKRDQSLSSLVFTENSDSKQNNFLQAHEIAKLKLNADLIVLSACETGFGKFEEGNGIASLARSFMYSGVSAMVVSLWKVNDASTKEMMQLFYSHLANGANKDAALRQAKLNYLSRANSTAAHPAYWSTFVMIGNTQPTKISRKGESDESNLKWWIAAGAALLILGAWSWKRRER